MVSRQLSNERLSKYSAMTTFTAFLSRPLPRQAMVALVTGTTNCLGTDRSNQT